jgi:exonuclease III
MKIIFLNAWNGRVYSDMAAYIKAHVPTTDIFCFQEAYDDMKSLCSSILSDYVLHSDYKFVTEDDDFPQATYVRKDIPIASSGSILKEQANCGLGLYVEVKLQDRSIFICNFHGMSRPVNKLDDPSRLLQSKTLIKLFKDKKYVVIGGDFNIFPETKSIKSFEKHGYRDLIKEFGVETTRNQLAWDMYPDNKQYYSDYVFISPSVNLAKFTVPDNKISDHLPMEVDINYQ